MPRENGKTNPPAFVLRSCRDKDVAVGRGKRAAPVPRPLHRGRAMLADSALATSWDAIQLKTRGLKKCEGSKGVSTLRCC